MAGEGRCLRLPDSELCCIMRSNLHKHVRKGTRKNSWVKSEHKAKHKRVAYLVASVKMATRGNPLEIETKSAKLP